MGAVRAALGVALFFLFPMCGIAGEIYGTISADGRPLAGVRVSVTCDRETRTSDPSDKYGSYRVVVRTQGQCTLVVPGSTPVQIRSYSGPVRYDFETRTQAGVRSLQRR